uniref:Uncharacterized protein AlNc14C513G12003 n=1 Tax=Albugo laibachii Nc14 TaxID=890382 RepID=F0X0Q9_9STRA|nr:conserved hypothetical protein [Albugo laibachii Nc14]|eukprot:CCA27353.1 conserved hypothetical protein [Albugo laibachii Nc14]
MATCYASWDKYDVEKHLQDVDVRLETENRERERQRIETRLCRSEKSALEDVNRSADALASRIAVAMLKAKDQNAQTIDSMRRKERFLRHKAQLIAQMRENRIDGKALKSLFHLYRAAKALRELEGLEASENDSKLFTSLYIALYLDIGHCELASSHFGRASRSFRNVLLRDDRNVDAWRSRGDTFEQMGVPLLAMMHWKRVLALDPKASRDALHRVMEEAVRPKAKAVTLDASLSEGDCLKQLLLCLEEGEILQTEEFYFASIERFQRALRLLSRSKYCEATLSDRLALSCHLNAASGYLGLHRRYVLGLEHCHEALRLEPQSAIVHFRTAQMYQRLYRYTKAMDHFSISREIGGEVFANEMSRCEFERSQYDLKHIFGEKRCDSIESMRLR